MASAGAAGSAGDGTPVEELSYTEASRELDEIVAFFEGRDVDVDQLVARLERATAIVDELDRRLRRTRVQVEKLVPRLAAVAGRSDAEADEELEEEAELEEADVLVEDLDEAVQEESTGSSPGLF
jgi:exodeoxyribonuclease VII small subunit